VAGGGGDVGLYRPSGRGSRKRRKAWRERRPATTGHGRGEFGIGAVDSVNECRLNLF
jgi:hypothetical protein